MSPTIKALDLREKVTVFVLTVGESSLLACLAALQNQTCSFKLERIENVAPMDRALQAQLDRCKTPFFVQVDADMILEPDAIERLYRLMEMMPQDIMQALISLRDEHLGREIVGIRIVRHALAVKYPFQPVQGCETDQMRRAAADGWLTTARIGQGIKPAGVHVTSMTPQAAYERYRTLFRRSRKDEGIDWVKPFAKEFLDRLLKDPGSELNLYAFLGAIAGILSPLSIAEGEKNALVVSDELISLYDHFGGGKK